VADVNDEIALAQFEKAVDGTRFNATLGRANVNVGVSPITKFRDETVPGYPTRRRGRDEPKAGSPMPSPASIVAIEPIVPRNTSPSDGIPASF